MMARKRRVVFEMETRVRGGEGKRRRNGVRKANTGVQWRKGGEGERRRPG